MGFIYRIALALVIIGAINWGLIGFFRFDLVASIFGGQTAAISRVVYALVGISGLVCIPLLFEPSKETSQDTTSQGYRTANYGTEFADEPEFTEIEVDETYVVAPNPENPPKKTSNKNKKK